VLQVRFLTGVSISLRFALALVVALGTSGHAFGALLCSLGKCGPECAMGRAESKLAQPVESCCSIQGIPGDAAFAPTEPDCDCQLTAKAESPSANVSVSAPVEPPLVLAAPTEVSLIAAVAPFDKETILFSGDRSPPDIVRHPDRGRAPPAP
jgi:hypothetical protein